MAKIDVFNLDRQKVGELELADEVFAAEVKEHLLHEVVAAQLASRRAGTRAAKERSAVQGSKKKLYKQKGTGNARHGAIRAPIYVGGGRAHPPRPQDWSYRPPRQVRAGALRSALSLIFKEGRLTVVDNIQLHEPKTKQMAAVLANFEDIWHDARRGQRRESKSSSFNPEHGRVTILASRGSQCL